MMKALESGSLREMSLGELAERARAIGRVYVTTMSSSKGLEFDVVLMLGVEEGRIPFWTSKGHQLAEERRKFYVSRTRARKAVHLFYSGRHLTQYGPRHDGPSLFLKAIGVA